MSTSAEETVKAALVSQYLAALATLREVVEHYPPDLWLDRSSGPAPWHLAYHALFYTHLYLQPSESAMRPWPKGREDYHFLGPQAWIPNHAPTFDEPYSQADILEYLALCEAEARRLIPALDLAAESGFGWIPLPKVEHQIYTLRHLENHTGALAARLAAAGVDTVWRGTAPAQA